MTGLEGLVDARVASGHGEGEGVTCHDGHAGLRIDFCFLSTALAGHLRSCRIDGDARGSDHQPVWIELDL